MAKPGTLYLIPTVIAEGTDDRVIPEGVRHVLRTLRHFLAEDARTARRYFSSLRIFANLEELQIEVLNKDTNEDQIPDLMKALLAGTDMGIVSESGCPGIADPGALAVAFAHQHQVTVVPLVGPSSVILALMASGMNGQQFAFHGYLPVDDKEAARSIRELDRESGIKGQTQIFIETPYRNTKLLKNLLRNLNPETRLCIAIDLTSPSQKVTSKSVADWRRDGAEIPKSPAIFLFLAQKNAIR